MPAGLCRETVRLAARVRCCRAVLPQLERRTQPGSASNFYEFGAIELCYRQIPEAASKPIHRQGVGNQSATKRSH